jgi:hypothetical protein
MFEVKAETATKLCEKLFISAGNNHTHANGTHANITTNNAGSMRRALRS